MAGDRVPRDAVEHGRNPEESLRPGESLDDRIAERTRALETEITERHRTEERFRLVVEACPSGMLIADQTGAIQLVNVKIEQMFGYPRDELLGKSVDMLVPAKFRAGHHRNREHYLEAPETRAMGVGRDLRGVRKDGTEFPVEIGLNPIQTEDGLLILSVIVDITERQVAEEKFRLAVEACPSGMLIANEGGSIVLVNAKIEQMFGYDRSELLRMSVDELVPQKYRAGHFRNRDSYYQTPETRAMGAGRDLRAVRRDGTEFPVEIGLNPIHTREGLLVLGVVVDITERRAAQEAIAQLNADLEERVRNRTAELLALNAELESFAYAVSHDLRAPIRAMDGFSQALLEDYGEKLDTTALDYLNRIRAGSQRMGNLIDGLLKLSRVARAELKVEEFDLSALAERLLDDLHHANPDRHVDVRVARNALVRGDRQLIGVALQNLLENAWKFTGKTERPFIEFGVTGEGAQRMFFVRDNGAGFDAAYSEKLFKPFERLHRVQDFEGTGIGLATVGRVVRKHGGTIRAEAAVNQGACFSFSFEPQMGISP